MTLEERASLRRLLRLVKGGDLDDPRLPWAVGHSANCMHRPTCANLYEERSHVDVTFPCSGLGWYEAHLIVHAINSLEELLDDLDAAEGIR